MVSLQMSIPIEISLVHFCSGIILSEYHILTSATCVEAVEGSERILQEYPSIPNKVDIVVTAGKIHLGKFENTEQESVVEKRYKHELWRLEPLQFDSGSSIDW